MKKPPVKNPASSKQLIKISAFFFAPAVLGIAFWLVTGATGAAAECTLCHKRTTTITLACNSLDYQRHIDHGDTVGACGATQIHGKKPEEPAKRDPSH